MDVTNFDCRQDQSFFIPGQRSSYLFNSKITGIDDADLCLLVGTDIKKEAPTLSSRIRQRYLLNDAFNVLELAKNILNFPTLRFG